MPCDTCFFFEPLRERYLESDGECRVNAPRFRISSGSNWPLVDKANWCGKYIAKTCFQTVTVEEMKGHK